MLKFASPLLRSRAKDILKVSLTRANLSTSRNCYPNFNVSSTVQDFRSTWSHLPAGTRKNDSEGDIVFLAGRVVAKREASKSLSFIDISDGNVHGLRKNCRLQVMAQKQTLEDSSALPQEISRGDIIGIRGFPGKSQNGELSIFSQELTVLAPCDRPIPDTAKNTLKDHDIRFRKRYLDIMTNERSRKILIVRSNIISFLRRYLEDRGFLEVETPTLSVAAGGANARAFQTKSVAFGKDTDLYLRIAPELYLKKLIIAGLDRVFEVGKVFRNEGVDSNHNPEFTTCEFYMAYTDYKYLMSFTEELIRSLVYAINGSYKVNVAKFKNDGSVDAEALEIDFELPFERISVIEGIEKFTNVAIPRPLDSEPTRECLSDLIDQHGIALSPPRTTARMLDKLIAISIEEHITDRPTFIVDHPLVMSPLAKPHAESADLTERFELFVNQHELCNAYSELSNYEDQISRFAKQAEAKEAGDAEAHTNDLDFCEALAHGLPPTSGWGIGIDRLVMLLTNVTHIREVISFPTVRPPSSEL